MLLRVNPQKLLKLLKMEQNRIPLVSICTLVYNHEPYLRECFDGILMQKTNFAFEVLVHDDASTDNSAAIIREYTAKYPNIFKPIYQTENQYSKGIKVNATYQYPRAKGKYIAICEGDDYWTDPLKLQKQVDFLEANPEYTMCFARAIEHYEDGSREDKLFSFVEDSDYEGIEFFENWIVATASVLYRTEILSTSLCKEFQTNKKIIFGDTPLFLTCAHYGKVRGMSDVVSVYRRHKGGFTRAVLKDYNRCKRYHYHELEIYKVFGDVYKKKSIEFFVKGHCNVFWETFWRRGLKTRYDFLHESLSVSVCVTIKVLCEMFKTRLKRRMGRTLPSKK